MLCILYVGLISTCLGLVGLLFEQALPERVVRRWMWLGIVCLAIVLPATYRVQHNAHIHMASVVSASSHDLLIGRWLMVSVWISIALAVTQALRVWYLIRRARLGATVIDGVSAVVTDGIGPATVGVVGARVVIPRWVLALPAMQRRYVLRHEEEHRSSHDTLLLFVASLAGVLLPWNLPIWWLLRRLRLAVEMDCDNRVVAALGDANAYGTLLLSVAEASNRGLSLQPALLGMGMLERRITALVSPATRTIAMRALAAAAAFAILVIVFMLPHPVAGH